MIPLMKPFQYANKTLPLIKTLPIHLTKTSTPHNTMTTQTTKLLPLSSSTLPPTKQLRIASLLPSTTDICISLRLDQHVVGITHECDFVPTHPLYRHSSDPLLATIDHDGSINNNKDCTTRDGDNIPVTLTISHIDSHILTQSEIDTAVKTSLQNGISLYTLHDSVHLKMLSQRLY